MESKKSYIDWWFFVYIESKGWKDQVRTDVNKCLDHFSKKKKETIELCLILDNYLVKKVK